MGLFIKEIRRKTNMTQKEFAEHFGIPLSTLRKWEQGESSPPQYVVRLLAGTLPVSDSSLRRIPGRNGEMFFYDEDNRVLRDAKGNTIMITEDLQGVKEQNLSLYITDLFEDFYRIRDKFEQDCRYDKQEDILWM